MYSDGVSTAVQAQRIEVGVKSPLVKKRVAEETKATKKKVSINDKLWLVEGVLNELFAGRRGEVTAALATLLSGNPIIFVGEPGTSKSELVKALARLVNAKYFGILLHPHTMPEELVGPIDIKAYRETGEYRHITKDMLPEAEIAFLDEIFKASPAIRNMLLDIILNRVFKNGARVVVVPLLALYTASNEVSDDEEDQAFYDRLTHRVFVQPVLTKMPEELIIKGLTLPEKKKKLRPVLSSDEIRMLQKRIKERAREEFTQREELRRRYSEAMVALRHKGLPITDRRFIQGTWTAAALATLYNEPQITLDTIADTLRLVAPASEDDLETIEQIITEYKIGSVTEEKMMLRTLIDSVNTASKELAEMLKTHNINIERYRSIKELYSKAVDEYRKHLENRKLRDELKQLYEAIMKLRNLIEKIEKEELAVDKSRLYEALERVE